MTRSLDHILIRTMTLDDVPAGLALCRASGWNQTASDWGDFLAAAPHGALVAVEGGRVVGSVATMPYGPFAWISMVLVEPAARGRGVGTLLLERGLALVPPTVAARLDATPAGEPLYRKLGFAPEYGLARLVLQQIQGQPARPSNARPLTPSDWPAVHAVDARVFGASRATLLERLASEAPEYAWVVEDRGRWRGYVLGRHGHVRDHIGPMVADDADAASTLLEACFAAGSGRSVLIDVPDAQVTWRSTLAELGFTIERPFLRMYCGPFTTPGQPSQVYAVTGPEFG
jgi:GNAT superfamily N-acetyltransferase